MFDDIDDLCNSHQEEQKSYLLGIQDAKEDSDVKKQISGLGRENFTRGHNAGFACGLVISALEFYLLEENSISKNNNNSDSTSTKETCTSILAECNSIVQKMKDLNDKQNDYQPETTYQKLDDDDEEENDDEAKNTKNNNDDEEEEEEELRNSFRVILVSVVEKFIHFWKKNVIDDNKSGVEFPHEQWQFLTSLVQDNKMGSPDNQTALTNLIQDATMNDNSDVVIGESRNNEEASEEQKQQTSSASSSVTATRRKTTVRVGTNSAAPKVPKKKTLDEVLDW